MKRLLQSLFLLPLLSGFFVFSTALAQPVSAQTQTCPYGSTQARVHKDFSDPWKQSMSINLGQQFEAGGFHDNTGQFASDVVIQVSGPGMLKFVSNGQRITPRRAGEYTVYVNTRNKFGGVCSEQAKVTVVAPTTCSYSSTQARIQRNVNEPWANVVSNATRAEGFNVASFHNGTGVVAGDTQLRLYGPGFNGVVTTNLARVLPPSTGWYRLNVKTNNQSGPACEQDAWVLVN